MSSRWRRRVYAWETIGRTADGVLGLTEANPTSTGSAEALAIIDSAKLPLGVEAPP